MARTHLRLVRLWASLNYQELPAWLRGLFLPVPRERGPQSRRALGCGGQRIMVAEAKFGDNRQGWEFWWVRRRYPGADTSGLPSRKTDLRAAGSDRRAGGSERTGSPDQVQMQVVPAATWRGLLTAPRPSRSPDLVFFLK